MRDSGRWVGARGVDARQHFWIYRLFFVRDQELQVSCRRRDFRFRKTIDKFVQLPFCSSGGGSPAMRILPR
jgi:hypothetical protein